MQVEATQTKDLTVDISPHEVKKIVLEEYYDVFNISKDMYIKNGQLLRDTESYGGSHSWFDTDVVREATEEDIAVFLVLDKLRKELG